MLQVRNPFSLEPIGEVPLGKWNFADTWLKTAARLHRDRDSWLPAFERIAILERAAAIMRERTEAVAALIANEGGKPLIDARVEVDRAIDGVGLAAHELRHHRGGEVPMDLTAPGAGRIAFTTREPIGPVVSKRSPVIPDPTATLRRVELWPRSSRITRTSCLGLGCSTG